VQEKPSVNSYQIHRWQSREEGEHKEHIIVARAYNEEVSIKMHYRLVCHNLEGGLQPLPKKLWRG